MAAEGMLGYGDRMQYSGVNGAAAGWPRKGPDAYKTRLLI